MLSAPTAVEGVVALVYPCVLKFFRLWKKVCSPFIELLSAACSQNHTGQNHMV